MRQQPRISSPGHLLLAWLGGLQKARPGITMQAQPATGTKAYAEGWGPATEWNDRAKVDQVGISNWVPTGCYHGVRPDRADGEGLSRTWALEVSGQIRLVEIP
jgi:hypothetical protein